MVIHQGLCRDGYYGAQGRRNRHNAHWRTRDVACVTSGCAIWPQIRHLRCAFRAKVYKYGEFIGRATQEIKVATMCTSNNVESERDVVTGNNIKQGKMIMSNETFWFPPP